MAKSIIARRKGDEYQARVFWLKLLRMRTGDYIQSVTLESDQVSFVDDVVVSYREPIKDQITGEREVIHEFIQCKYHMTKGGAFTHINLIDPDFIKCKDSMLKRLYDAYVCLSDEIGKNTFRLCIFSDWHWDHRDVLSDHLHEGMIRPTFYERGERSERGKVRSQLAAHLEISQEELRLFLNTVRFTLGKSLADLISDMDPLLKLAGLHPIDPTRTNVVYDDLAWKLFSQGKNSFDEETFDQMVREEKLIFDSFTEHSEISIQSFSQFARRPHDLQAAHLDLLQFFNERFLKDNSDWNKEIPAQIREFMLNKNMISIPQPVHIFFDCHLSIAFFAGYLISPKHRVQIIPTQKSKSDYTLWEPNTTNSDSELWKFQKSEEIDDELVLGISVTHSVKPHMQLYLESEGLTHLPQILVSPITGTDPKAVSGGDHAWQLGYQLASRLSEMVPITCQKINLFFAGPVALGYILGQTLRHITPIIQLYEHDYEGLHYEHRYYPSLRIPS